MSFHSVFSEQHIGVNSLKVMTTLNEFLQFVRLPIELQLLVFQFAFHLRPGRSHTPLLITPSTSLSKALRLKHDYLNRPVSSEDCESSTWPRIAPMPRNWLIHDKNIYSSHGNGEWKIYLRSNGCVEGGCWSVKHVKMEAGESVCLGENVEIGGGNESEGGSGGYRVVLEKKESLVGLLQACRLSRMVVLEEWIKLLEGKGRKEMGEVEGEEFICAPYVEWWSGECDGGEVEKRKEENSRKEMVKGVVGKVLDELRSGAACREEEKGREGERDCP